MPKKTPDLTLIIVSSHQTMLDRCLRSLVPALEMIKNEVIVVDNASTKVLSSVLGKKFPLVKFIRRSTNGGFGENNNLGIKVAKGRYTLLLNDDTQILDKNILLEMIKWMDEHPDAGVSGCGLLEPDQKTLQGSGGYFPNLFRVFAWMTFLDDIPILDRIIKPFHPMHNWSPVYKGENYFKKPHKQDWVTGAFFLMRSEALKQVGGFDEDFFLYVEEVELSLRFVKKGWEIWYLPKWKIVHYGQTTTGSGNSIIYELKNLQILYEKHYPAWQKPILKLIIKAGIILRILVFGLFKGKDVSEIYVKAYKEI